MLGSEGRRMGIAASIRRPRRAGNVGAVGGPDDGTKSGKLLAGVRWELRTLLGRYPAVALPLLRARGGDGFLAPIRDETEVVIDGFPRSGNTFAVAAFHFAQLPRDVKIAHHVHLPAQLLSALRLRLPPPLLVRHPHEA